jgi:hypothetical protein
MASRDEHDPIEVDDQQKKKNPLWNHVVLLEKAAAGGNAIWRCKYCRLEYKGSYSRIKSHLLRISGGGIKICTAVDKFVLAQLQNEVAEAADEIERSKAKVIPLPVANVDASSSMRNKRQRSSALQKAFDMETRSQLDALIARMFYSGGLQKTSFISIKQFRVLGILLHLYVFILPFRCVL